MNEELTAGFAQLERGRKALLSLSNDLGPDRLGVPLGREEWSFNQHVEHLVLSERVLLMSLKRASPPAARPGVFGVIRAAAVDLVMRLGIKVPVPYPELEPHSSKSFEELTAEWESVRGRISKTLGSLPKSEDGLHVFDHPVGGPKDVEGTVRFMRGHQGYHYLRIARLLRKAKLQGI